jgi:putative transposase
MKNIYKRHRFPPEIIQYPVWLYSPFNLSHRDIEDLLAQRGVTASHEMVCLWCNKFEAKFPKRLCKKHKGFDDTFYLDEVFVKINDIQHYLWRAVDQGGDVIGAFLQKHPDGTAAKHLFKRLLKHNGEEPRKIVTDKLRSYCVAHR